MPDTIPSALHGTSLFSLVHYCSGSQMGLFDPVEHFAMSGVIFGCQNIEQRVSTIGVYGIEARDPAKYPSMQIAASATKNYPVQHGNHAEVKKPCPIFIFT